MLEINLEPRLAAGEGWTERKVDKARGRKRVEKDNLNQDHRSLNTHLHLHYNTRTEEFFELNN